jgi:hypothetical protein
MSSMLPEVDGDATKGRRCSRLLHAVVEDAATVVLPAMGVFFGDYRWFRGATV